MRGDSCCNVRFRTGQRMRRAGPCHTLYTTPAMVVPVFQCLGPWQPLDSNRALRLHRLKSNPPSEDMIYPAAADPSRPRYLAVMWPVSQSSKQL